MYNEDILDRPKANSIEIEIVDLKDIHEDAAIEEEKANVISCPSCSHDIFAPLGPGSTEIICGHCQSRTSVVRQSTIAPEGHNRRKSSLAYWDNALEGDIERSPTSKTFSSEYDGEVADSPSHRKTESDYDFGRKDEVVVHFDTRQTVGFALDRYGKVTQVTKGSQAHTKNVKVNWTLIALNGEPVHFSRKLERDVRTLFKRQSAGGTMILTFDKTLSAGKGCCGGCRWLTTSCGFRYGKNFFSTTSQALDVGTDIFVMLQLKNTNVKFWWLPIAFILLSYIVCLVMMYRPLIGWLTQTPDKQRSKYWIVVYMIFGIPLMILYDIWITITCVLSLGYIQPRQLGKLYHITKISNEAIFEALPQVVFQTIVYTKFDQITSSVATAIDDPSQFLELLLPLSLALSLFNLIRALFSCRKFASYMKVSPHIRGPMVGLYENSEKEVKLPMLELDDEDINGLSKALQVNGSLITLDLGRNRITDLGAKYVWLAISHNRSLPLKRLNLASNQIGDIGLHSIDAALRGSLEQLNLSNNQIGDSGAQHLADGLGTTKRLRLLNISRNQISASGGVKIGKALWGNKSLRGLRITDNRLKAKGAKAIAEGISRHKFIHEILLDRNEISDKGGSDVARMFIKHKTLILISMKGNQLGASSDNSFGILLQRNQTLRYLLLSNNTLGAGGLKGIAAGIKNNKSLKQLALDGNQMSDGAALTVARAVTKLKVFESLDLRNIYFKKIETVQTLSKIAGKKTILYGKSEAALAHETAPKIAVNV